MTSQGKRDTAQKQETSETLSRPSGYLTNGAFSRFLEIKRAQSQKEPFRGFNSPPGRF